jgi:prepilin-type N-terminal cleavage/methylation domain-containing protein
MKKSFIRRSASGFTLIELVMALAVSGILLSAISASLYQVFTNSQKNTAHMLAVKQVENAVHFLVRDVEMAQHVRTSGLDTGEVLELSWTDWEAVETVITYSWDSTNHTLIRDHSRDGTSTTIAYAVVNAPVISPQPFTASDQKLLINITCTVAGHNEERALEIAPRPGI